MSARDLAATAKKAMPDLGPVEVVVNGVRYAREETLFAALGENDSLKERLERAEEALRQAEMRAVEGRILLARFEYLPYGATVARSVVDGEWITDSESAAACNQFDFECPVCGWPQKGHGGPGSYKGNAENTHEEGCSLRAVLDGEPAPRLRALAAAGADTP